MRWIKLQELPKTDDMYVCKLVKKGNGETSEIVAYAEFKKAYGYFFEQNGYVVIEWLDESDVTDTNVGDISREKEGLTDEDLFKVKNLLVENRELREALEKIAVMIENNVKPLSELVFQIHDIALKNIKS